MAEVDDCSVPPAYIEAAIERAREIDGFPLSGPQREIRKIGIVGAGTMGGGIAMCFADGGVPVRIVERKQEALDRGLSLIRSNYERSASRGRLSEDDVAVRMALISGSLVLDDLVDCDLVIEAVFENMELKRSLFAELDAIVRPDAILASNTSALNLDQIAIVTSRPESVIGMHFFSPANVMKLLEVVRGAKTGDDVIATVMALATKIQKIPVLVGVCFGFVGNRMLYPRQMRAQQLLKEGAMPWDIDRVLRNFGFKMGPFEMTDLAGLDIGWRKGANTGDPIRDALCEIDRRGQKTRAGYYDYDDARRPMPSETVAAIIRRELAVDPGARCPSDQEILESCLYPMINEGAKILGEKIAQRASDIDVVWVFGYGWPATTGGPMKWADTIGLGRVLAKAEALGRENPWYAPAPLLRELVDAGRRFEDLAAA